MKSRHTLYYIFESIILGFGLFMVFLAGNVYDQILMLFILISVYITTGAVHHKMTHDINPKIVLEYVLIGALVFSIFLLFKSGAV
jgi:hypothetical protein